MSLAIRFVIISKAEIADWLIALKCNLRYLAILLESQALMQA